MPEPIFSTTSGALKMGFSSKEVRIDPKLIISFLTERFTDLDKLKLFMVVLF